MTTLLSVPAAAAAPSAGADYPCEPYLKAWAGKTVVSRWKFHIDGAGRPDRAVADSLSAGHRRAASARRPWVAGEVAATTAGT
ncbi:hypothetical protein GCM10010211_80100 [Streptomyces albospinus]|uniref:Uncharacterized protein n=1 Tax=Streptomyces albospinus TaxID=285515 RepID=A0ABQ2VN21_9ACTN|nr:hypothetical protein GCM10010211_80100 [Streptomyces albospinus]